MRTLITLLLIGIGIIQSPVYSAELSASELARALNVDWWEVRLPGSPSEQFAVELAVDFGDGRKPHRPSQTWPHFTGDSKIKVFCQRIPNSDTMVLAIVSEKVKWSRTDDVFPKGTCGYMVNIGSTAKPGEYLLKGSTDDSSLVMDQSLRKNEFALKVVVQKVN